MDTYTDTWLDESVSAYLNRIEDIGWTRIDQLNSLTDDEGPTLSSLQGASSRLREAAATQPLPKRGNQLRHAYVFGRGMLFSNIDKKPRVTSVIDDPHNKSVLFSVEAYEQANAAKFTDGIFCVVYDQTRKRFTQIPLDRISGVQTDPNDPMDILAVQTTWNGKGQAWIKLSRNRKEKISLNAGEWVVNNVVAYVSHANRQSGWTFGVPDSLAGHVFMLTYNAYLRDNAELVHALSKIAWKITTPNKAAVQKAAGVVEGSKNEGVGGTVASSGDLSGVGVPSAQVDFNKGQPLAGMVATSYGVPVIALIASPGATGGSYGAATTLDAPTLKGFEAVQDSWKLFYEEILRDLGARDVEISFPTISNDPEYRQVSSIAQSVELGAVWHDEARAKVLDLLNIEKLHENLPPKPKEDTDNPNAGGSDTVVAKRGKPGKGASNTPDNPTNHDNDDTK